MKKIISFFILVILCLSAALSGCSSSTFSDNAKTPQPPQQIDAPSPDAEVTQESSMGNFSDVPIPETNRKLIYTSNFEIETMNFRDDYNKIMDLLGNVGGYVQSEDTQGMPQNAYVQYGQTTYLALRVPIDEYNNFLNSISAIGTLKSKNRNTADVSSQYFDTESRIKLLEDRKDRLMKYLSEATKTEDIIQLEQEITNVLYELDQYQGKKRQLDDLVDYSTISINLYEALSPINGPSTSLEERSQNAFITSMEGVSQFLQSFAVGFSFALPVIILILIITVITLLVIILCRKAKKSFQTKKTAKYAKFNEPPTNTNFTEIDANNTTTTNVNNTDNNINKDNINNQ